MKKIILKIILASIMNISANSVNAQTFEWAKSLGGSGNGTFYDQGNSIAVDASGIIIQHQEFSTLMLLSV